VSKLRLLDNFTAQDSLSGLCLGLPKAVLLPSYLAALQAGLQPARHQTSLAEYEALLQNFDHTWPAFTTEIANGFDNTDFCFERLYWLSRNQEFIGYMSLRTDLRGARQIYGGNAGRELHAPYRNQGLGTVGLELLKLLAKAQNFSELIFVTAENNLAALRSLHKGGAAIIEKIPNPQNHYFNTDALKLRIALP
jgi:predicted acetyltransferase